MDEYIHRPLYAPVGKVYINWFPIVFSTAGSVDAIS